MGDKFDGFLQGLVDEHRSGNIGGDTLINHLLALQKSQSEYYTDQIIKGLILVSITDFTCFTSFGFSQITLQVIPYFNQ